MSLEWSECSRKVCCLSGPEAGSHRPRSPPTFHSDVPCRLLVPLVLGCQMQPLLQESDVDTSMEAATRTSICKDQGNRGGPQQTPPCSWSRQGGACPCLPWAGGWQGSGAYHDRGSLLPGLAVGGGSHPTWEIIQQKLCLFFALLCV